MEASNLFPSFLGEYGAECCPKISQFLPSFLLIQLIQNKSLGLRADFRRRNMREFQHLKGWRTQCDDSLILFAGCAYLIKTWCTQEMCFHCHKAWQQWSGQIIIFHQPRFPSKKGDVPYQTNLTTPCCFMCCFPSFLWNSKALGNQG